MRPWTLSWFRYVIIGVAALLIASTAAPNPAAAQTRISVTVSSAYFHQRLSPYGTWIRHTRWGDVWRPHGSKVFRPYLDGHWTYTADYGVIFVSTTVWGDIVYHYGRWVYDPEYGWVWIPGYVWAPAWVVWRIGAGYVAWLPMPPCSNYYGSYFGTAGVYTGGFYDDRYYGYECYQDWYGTSISFTVFLSYWTVVPEAHFFAPNLSRWRLHHRNYPTILRKTQNITDYTTADNHVVNKSFTRPRLNKLLGKPVAPTPLRDAVRKGAVITPVPAGRTLERKAGPRVPRNFVPERRTTPVRPRAAPPAVQPRAVPPRAPQPRAIQPPQPAQPRRSQPSRSSQPAAKPRGEKQPQKDRRPGTPPDLQ